MWGSNDGKNSSQHFNGIFSKPGTVLGALLMSRVITVDTLFCSSRYQSSFNQNHTASKEQSSDSGLKLEMRFESQLVA